MYWHSIVELAFSCETTVRLSTSVKSHYCILCINILMLCRCCDRYHGSRWYERGMELYRDLPRFNLVPSKAFCCMRTMTIALRQNVVQNLSDPNISETTISKNDHYWGTFSCLFQVYFEYLFFWQVFRLLEIGSDRKIIVIFLFFLLPEILFNILNADDIPGECFDCGAHQTFKNGNKCLFVS